MLPIVISGLALLASAASSLTGRKALHQSRIALVSQVRTEWVKLAPDWSLSLVLARGPEDYYSYASRETRDRVRQIGDETDGLDWDDTRAVKNAFVGPVQNVVTFLDFCAGLVLQGRLRSRDVYNVLGPEITRHGAAIRWMIGVKTGMWALDSVPDGADRSMWLHEVQRDAFRAQQNRILALIDLLWARSADAGDHYPHVLMTCAIHKRYLTGAFCRRRVRLLARRSGGRLLGMTLQRELLAAEFLKVPALWQDGSEFGLVPVDWKCVRVGLWRVRSSLAFLRSYVFLTPRFFLWRRRVATRLERNRFGKSIVKRVVLWTRTRRTDHPRVHLQGPHL